MSVRAESVRPARSWQIEPDGGHAGVLVDRFRRNRARIGFATAALLLIVGWSTRDLRLTNAESGLGYALGYVSLVCMLVLLLYPLRKRFRWLRFIGPLPKWFRNHMVLGVSAPIAALYHCGFKLGSLNSRIALFSALAVAGSGLVGRFIYSKVHHGLYGRKASLKDLLAQVKTTSPGVGRMGRFIPELMARLRHFDQSVLVPPASLFDCVRLPFVLAVRTRYQSYRLRRFIRVSLAFHARQSPAVAARRAELERVIVRYVRRHLRQVRRVAEFTAYDRLLALWHRVHRPFFLLLFVSVTVHVAVVHLY